MTNSIVPIAAEISTLEAEGLALAKEWKSICKADKTRFTKATSAEGFDTRLGKLMVALKAEANGRISSARLKDCGIHSIDKRRRSEALWFVENETACREFIKASKKGFTSLTALQAAMKKSLKAAQEQLEPVLKQAVEEGVVPPQSGADKSNVGLNSEADESPFAEKSASDIALDALVQCEVNGITVKDFMLALKEQLEMLDKVAA